MRGVLFDLGGVLLADVWPAAARMWSARLGRSPMEILAAVFAGSDDQVLIGRVTEPVWWEVVAGRLGLGAAVVDELRADLTRLEIWDRTLVAAVRGLRGIARTAIVSNAWPDTRARLAATGLDLVEHWVMSCEVGHAKPDRRIFDAALARLAVAPANALFIDDTSEHVDAARALGLHGHLHRDSKVTIAVIERFVAGASPRSA